MGSREFWEAPAKGMMSQRDIDAVMSLQNDEVLTLLDVLDQASKARNVPLNLSKKSSYIRQEICGLRSIFPPSCVLSNVSKEGDMPIASSEFSDVWKGRQGDSSVRIKTFRAYLAESPSKIKQYLCREIESWKGLSHPNVLPVLGISPELSPLCIVTAWMPNGNIMDFLSKHPEANRLRLLAEASRGLRYLHLRDIIHGNLKPENILVDHGCHPRLIDYGFPLQIPTGPRIALPTDENDISALGTVIYDVLTGRRHFLEAQGLAMDRVPMEMRPDNNEWLSDNVWNLVCRCLSPSSDDRPNLDVVVNTLDEAEDIVELRSWGIKEADFGSFLDNFKYGRRVDLEANKAVAQRIVNVLSSALEREEGGLDQPEIRQYQVYLRRFCKAFDILPRSLVLESTLIEYKNDPFATGGFSDVYKATIGGNVIAIKTLRVSFEAHRNSLKPFVKEVIAWKWLQHDNVLPLFGVVFDSPRFSMISEFMENGNIMDFIKIHPNHNRMQLLVGAASGLKYLHDHDVIHGDMKGANILIDSTFHARLADFGLAAIINESTSNTADNLMRGTSRWMAPELMYPDKFGFTSKFRRRLPSRGTDIYGLGMTILEVITGCSPFSHIQTTPAVLYNVLDGNRPNRPPSGFSDQLWELLETTWLEEHASQPSKRPQISATIDQLNKEAHQWQKSILQQLPVQIVESRDSITDVSLEGTQKNSHPQVLSLGTRSDDDNLTLVDVLDQACVHLSLRRSGVRILQRVCCLQATLPRSCTLSDNISKEGDIAFASGWLANVWKGRYNRDYVCLKALRVYKAKNLSKIKQRLFQEIVIWRHLSHPNIMPVLGVSTEPFPLCVVTKWMVEGNIANFTLKHPEVNRLHLLAGVANGLKYLHSLDIVHGNLKPTNILVDSDLQPRLTDHGIAHLMDKEMVYYIPSTTFSSEVAIRYMAPELLDPSDFGLEDSSPTKESDIYAFGLVTYRVTTERRPFPGEQPSRPSGLSESVSDNVWDLISRCCSPRWDDRPGASFLMNALDVEAGVHQQNLRPVPQVAKAQRSGLRTIIDRQRNRLLKWLAVTPGKSQPALDPNKYPAETSTLPRVLKAQLEPLEPWEVDLVKFLHVCETGANIRQKGNRAQEFVGKLDAALEKKDLPGGKRKQHLMDLRKLCCMFETLPSSFVLAPAPDEHGITLGTGGSSEVYEATFGGRCVAIKTFGAANADGCRKLLVKEVIGWKWLHHENILPFVGVFPKPPLFSIVSERMENGNVMKFTKAHPNYNRLHLLAGAVTGLGYLHKQGIIHGDLKGGNILIDSECRARLADFGLSVIVDESSVRSDCEVNGTVRWMAPELFFPEHFGFTNVDLRRLPSQSTDIYAMGMTIFEVLTGCRPFDDTQRPYTVQYKVISGDRPDRPPIGFSDTLWELLVATWVVEDGPDSQRRPSPSTVLDWLKKDVDRWGKSIVPLVPERWQETVHSNGF